MTNTRPSPELAAFGARLAAARKVQGLSQTELAALIGVSLPRYHAWEHAIALPNRIELYGRLCQHLAVTVDWLFFGNSAALPRGLKQRLDAQSAPLQL